MTDAGRVLVVKYTNTGQEVVHIDRVSMGCGCMEATLLGEADVQPKTTVAIEVQLHGAKMNIGAYRHDLMLMRESEVVDSVSVRYKFAPKVSVSPKRMYLLDSADDPTCRGEFVVDELQANSTVTATCSDTTVRLEVQADHKDLQRRRIKLSTTDRTPFGKLETSVQVFTGDSEPEWVVPVSADVPQPVRAIPETIIADLRHQPVVLREIKLRVPIACRLLRVRTLGPGLTVLPRAGESGEWKSFDVRIERASGNEISPHRSVVFEFDGERRFDVTVEVLCE